MMTPRRKIDEITYEVEDQATDEAVELNTGRRSAKGNKVQTDTQPEQIGP